MALRKQDLSFSIRQGFVRTLPELRRLLSWCFRYQDPEKRSESISEGIAFAFRMYKAAREAGKEVDVHPLARYATLTVRSGACFSGTTRVDAFSLPGYRSKVSSRPIRLGALGRSVDSLLPDRKGHWPISDQVAFRIDWSDFMTQCSWKNRVIMDMLAAGYQRKEVAQTLNVTPPAITQRMNLVHHRWRCFQG